jgi:uncharacterized protein YjbJ (UPF0337 family)
MGLKDKVSGRIKQAAGDLKGDDSLRREGVLEERKGEAREELAREEEAIAEKRREVADLERESARRGRV